MPGCREAQLEADRIAEEHKTGKRISDAVRPNDGRGLIGKKLTLLPEIDLDVVDVRAVAITATPQGETMISLEMSGGRIMNSIFSPATLAPLEAMLDMANEARARERPIQ